MPDRRTPEQLTHPSRRRFLLDAARGSLGLAAVAGLPGAAAADDAARAVSGPRDRRADARLPAAPQAPDEAYWRLVKAQFPLRDGVIPMNAANLCPAPRSVLDACTQAMRDVEGDVSFQNRAKYGELREQARAKLAAYLNAAPDEIAIVRNTSEANNIIVGGLALGPGDEVLLFDENHPTNNVAWDVRAARHGFTVRRVKLETPPAAGDEILTAFRRALSPRTRALSFSDVSNVTGTRLPTKELCALARERGIYAHVDGAQTCGALRCDLRDLGCDSFSASAHKWLMGPKEAGVLFVRQERIAQIWPGVVGVGWGSTAETEARGARKFETLGQRNDALVAAVGTTIDFHQAIGADAIEARVLQLAGAVREGLLALSGVQPVTPTAPGVSAGVVIVRIDGRDNRQLYERLYREHGVAAAATGGLRFSPHIYNTLADIEHTVKSVAQLLRGTPSP
jgi:selenocysteine lyase/cysteine desulfurase